MAARRVAPDQARLRRLRQPLASALAVRRRLRPLLAGNGAATAVLTGASIGAGLTEAAVLVVVADVAAALVLHGHQVDNTLQVAGLSLSVGEALLLALGLAAARLILQLVVAWLPARISADVQARLRIELFGAFTGASWAVQADQAEGQLQELMTDQIAQATQAVMSVANSLTAAAMFLALLVSAFVVNPFVALLVLATAVILFEGLRPVDRLGRRSAQDMSQSTMEHASAVSESVRLAQEAQVFGAGPAHRQHVGALVEAVRVNFYRTQLTSRAIVNVYQSLVIVLIVAGLGGLYLLGTGHLASLGAVVLMLVRASAYGQQFQSANHALIQALPYVDRLEASVATYRASAPADDGRPLPAIRTLAFDRVDFAYPRARTVLHEVSFEVAPGEAVGVIGPTGAGKSTLTQLLLRLRDPDAGAYLINGEPARTFTRSDWQRRVAYVPQDPQVFTGTVADNIRFYRDLDDAAVERAARAAHIHDEIVSMPAAYATIIGQRADAVSGGQRQRICLARALVGRPNVLVLDEPTSNLDMASEAAIQASLAELHGRVILFIVAHRVSILDICDRVLVLEGGRVKAFAPLTELARSNAFYQRVVSVGMRSA
jgi:ABC-type multidrug transport system fused ATPase/permease subunit